jgi:hypothetical protein
VTVAEMVKAEKDLGVDLEKYAGQWVAISGYEVMSSSDTLDGLLEQIEQQGIEESAEIRQIAAERTAACFF